jgi:hypothetical protein
MEKFEKYSVGKGICVGAVAYIGSGDILLSLGLGSLFCGLDSFNNHYISEEGKKRSG